MSHRRQPWVAGRPQYVPRGPIGEGINALTWDNDWEYHALRRARIAARGAAVFVFSRCRDCADICHRIDTRCAASGAEPETRECGFERPAGRHTVSASWPALSLLGGGFGFVSLMARSAFSTWGNPCAAPVSVGGYWMRASELWSPDAMHVARRILVLVG